MSEFEPFLLVPTGLIVGLIFQALDVSLVVIVVASVILGAWIAHRMRA